jgi:hypothetical protein
MVCWSSLYGTDIDATNMTIQNSMSLGQININGSPTSVTTVPGFRVSVTQDTANETFIQTIYQEGWWEISETVVEDWGLITDGSEGYWEDIVEWQVTGGYWIDEVWEDGGYYDENGEWVDEATLVAGAEWIEEGEEVIVGQNWVDAVEEVWGVISSYIDYQEIYHEGETETEEVNYVGYLRPKIKFSATRTDANWVWQVPTSNTNPNNARDIFQLFDGGAKVVSQDENINMALMADNLTYSKIVSGAEVNTTSASTTKAGEVEMQAHHVYSDGAQIKDVASLDGRKLTMTYKYTTPENVLTTKQTQIGAESSYFGGLVTMENNLHVQGVVRVAPAGNLSMGSYTQGPTPTYQP